MPSRNKVLGLPTEVKQELDRRLVASGFQGYDALAAWLLEQGYEISRSSVHRYGKEFGERLAMLRVATEQAKAIVEEMGDDAGAMGEALTAVAQEKAFQVLMELSLEEASDVNFDKLLAGIARINSAAVQQKKWRADVLKRAEAVVAEVEEMVEGGGLSDDAAAQLRAKILGIAK